MKVQKLELNWFRGGVKVELPLQGRSALIYGPNGSGKSTFPDAIELAVKGQIDHLSHEYSRSYPGGALRNTHTPDDETSGFTFRFDDDEYLRAVIDTEGRTDFDTSSDAIEQELLPFAVLRQDEISRFITQDKSLRYSQLMPMLDLEAYESTIEYIHGLILEIKRQADPEKIRAGAQGQLRGARRDLGESLSDPDAALAALAERFLAESIGSQSNVASLVQDAIKSRISESNPPN